MRRVIVLMMVLVIVMAPVPAKAQTFNFTTPILSWHWLYYSNMDAGEGIYGSFTIEAGKDINFFVVDQDGYDTISGMGTVTPERDWGERTGSVSFTFITPYADSWYFCWSNYDGFTTVDIDGEVYIDTTAPIITIGRPASSATVSGTITIEASARDAVFDVEEMRIYIDNHLKRTSSSGSISYSWNTESETDGPHTIEFYAADNVGNSRTVARYVTVANTVAPTTGGTDGTGGTSTPMATISPMLGLFFLLLVVGLSIIAIRRRGGPSELPEPSPVTKPPPPPVQRVYREREVIERVLVICPYCSTKTEQGIPYCPNCGGKL